MLSFAAKTCYNRFCFRRKRFFGHFSGWKGSRVVYAACHRHRFFSFCSSRARASITPPARWITNRPCAVIGSTSITPVPRATATSICSVNSRFPLDFERKISYTKSVISRRCGGIGRRPGFKIPCSQERAGSTPATGTTLEKTEPVFCRFGFYFTAPLLSAFHRMRSSEIASPPPGRTHTPSLFPTRTASASCE